jgi:hypothetical protein
MNVPTDPRAGLVIPDSDTGGAAQRTGVATLDWDGVEARRRPGALRQIESDTVVELDGTSQSWQHQPYPTHNREHRPT